jgi:hypothetical protein
MNSRFEVLNLNFFTGRCVIVFTVTNNESGRVFVASSRNAPEDRWEQLISQALEGSEGEIFNEIRNFDSSVFSVDEWGFGEDPKEIRQLMREAQHDLDATVINTGKTDRLPSAKRKKLTDVEASKLLEDLEKSISGGSEFDDIIPTPSLDPDDVATDEKLSQAETSTQSTTPAVSTEAATPSVSTTPKKSTPAISESLIEKLARKVEREKIEENAKKLIQKKATLPAKPKTTIEAPIQDKLPTGRTSSRAKEQRIKEGIEQAREDRAQARQASERREAVEMRKVITAIELRRKTQTPAKVKAKAKAATKTLSKSPTLSKSTTLKKVTTKDAPLTKTKAAKMALIAKAFQDTSPVEKPVELLFDRAMAIKSAKALNGIIRAKRAQQYAPKAATSPEAKATTISAPKSDSSLSFQDKRLQRMIEKENAMLAAKKAAMNSASAEEMASVVARIDSRSQESNRTLTRR